MQYFDSLRASWLESFDLLRHESMKMLLLVSLKTLITVYRSLLYAWFLPITLLIGLVLTIPRLLAAFYITLIIRAARPSMVYKDIRYWQQMSVADWILFFFVVSITALARLIVDPLSSLQTEQVMYYLYQLVLKILFLAEHIWLPSSEQLWIIIPFLSPFLITWMLFLLDAKNSLWAPLESFGRSLIMNLYNYPFFLIVYAVFRALIEAGFFIITYLAPSLPYLFPIGVLILFGIAIPYWICLITNFYIKRLHEQFSIYYTTPHA